MFSSITYAAASVLSEAISYDNSNSTLTSTNVQDAIDELYLKINSLYTYTKKGTLFYQIESNAFLDNISSTYVASSTGIDFGNISSDTNGKGVYEMASTKDNTYPIYYYRGAVTDNNVIFAGFCWKIVRTTETAGIKLIYNGIPSSNQCNNTGTSSQIGTSAFNSSYNKNAYVGYMYGTAGSSSYYTEHTNTNNSTIKAAIDNWYVSNMINYVDKLEDTIWCNDRSVYSGNGYGTSETYYGAYNRLINNNIPSLLCSQDNDKFTVSTDNGNGGLTYPVGLLTADEIAYAGGVYGTNNSNYYLNTTQSWWSTSPYIFYNSDAYEFYVYLDGGFYSGHVSGTFGVRPAISLKPGTTYSSGSGTVNDPYIVN